MAVAVVSNTDGAGCLAFVLVTVYYGERLMFFDVFAKRGLLFFSSLAIVTSYLALILPYFILRNMGFLISWITSLALLPILLYHGYRPQQTAGSIASG